MEGEEMTSVEHEKPTEMEGSTTKLTSTGKPTDEFVEKLSASWKCSFTAIQSMNEAKSEQLLRHGLSEVTKSLKEYEEQWKAFSELFHPDKDERFKEIYKENNDIFLENMSTATDAFARASRELEKFTAETRSVRSRRSGESLVSRSSSISSMRAKALAEAAAAKEKLRFAQEIAALKAKQAVKRATEDAELQAKLEILQAEQEVAETAARAEALSEVDDNSIIVRGSCHLTSPNDTANDHARRFVQSFQTETAPKSENPHTEPEIQIQPPTKPSPNATEETTRIITEAISTAMNCKNIKAPEPPIFSGDPLKYPDWKISFNGLIEQHVPVAERIHYLKRYVSGPAKEAVTGYFLLKDDSAYQKAKDVLEERYGNPYMVAEAFRDKLDKWPKIDHRNYEELRRFSDFLLQCSAATKEISSLDILNDTREIGKLLEKLPTWITNRWKRFAVNTKKSSGKYPGLDELAQFVKTESDIVCDPAIGNFKDKRKPVNSNATKPKVFNARNMATNIETTFCVNCEKPNHSLTECRKFGAKTEAEKQEFIMKNGLCYGCLKRGHRSKDCQQRATCSTCKGKHPSSLHKDKSVANQRPSVNVTEESTNRAVDTTNSSSTPSVEMTSMVVPVWVSIQEFPSEEVLTYALLDSQSDSTFISDELAGKLKAKPIKTALRLTTMTSDRKIIQCKKFTTLQARRFDDERHIKLPTTFTRQIIPANKSHVATTETARRYPHLNSISDLVPPLQECGFGLLIGYNCSEALAPINFINGGDGQPCAIETKLGWSIVGTHSPQRSEEVDEIGLSHRILTTEICMDHNTSKQHYVLRTKVKELGPGDAIKALEMDFVGEKVTENPYSVDDKRFLELQTASIHVNEDGHIEMPLPFRSRPELPNNRSMALCRLNHLKKKFMKDNKYYQHYKMFMEDIIKNGDAEMVQNEDDAEKVCWYIPHHGVYHPHKPDKIRVVFDCSARFGKTSLNEHLLTGPDLTNKLLGVLCRFRQEEIAMMCDIERMFHQFHVDPNDRDFLRFLWWKSGDLHTEPSTYRMRVHLFGAGSSPGCANFGFKYVADLYSTTDQQDAKEFLQRNFYVDDGLRSVDKVSTAIKLIDDATSICAQGSLRLHKFISNNREVMSAIPRSEQAKEVKDLDLAFDNLPMERALGIHWCVESDEFRFRIVLKNQPMTRRGILSTVASIYDPLGLLAPYVLKGKQILQLMCREGTDWDEPLSQELRPKWERWLTELHTLSSLKIKRCFRPKNLGQVKTVELHHFSDASSSGYGQCSYIRLVGETEVGCTLVMGKARVTPLKTVTIPRLELQAAVVSSEVSSILNRELEYENVTNYFWTDSQVVMGYINNDSRRFHVYVANRVQRIRNSTKPYQWNYISTDENPADHASRGLLVQELISSNWFKGPAFLLKPELEFATCSTDISSDDPEVKARHVLAVAATPVDPILDRIGHFSNWTEAVRGISALRGLVRRKQGLTQKPRIEELKDTEIFILKLLQQHHFKNEIHLLETKKPKVKGQLWKLDPYLDEEGILRVGGRLRRTSMSQKSKHQILVPKKSHITDLLIKHFHEKVAHQGRGFTTNSIRSNGYWIIGLSSAVSSHIYKCITCRKLRGRTQVQKMSDLPTQRLEPSPPFTYCGVDCFGPYIIKDGRKELKKYGLLFTCMSSRAIHLEMLDDMTSDAFINSLRCMISIRGRIRQIFCDQGSNFIGAINEFKKCHKEMKDQHVKKFLEERECEFILNTPSSSHMGGFWERQIRSIRSILTSILHQHKARLDCSSLRAFLYETMAIVNSRPLTVENLNDPNGPEPLTPNHLLTTKSELILPPLGEFVKEDIYTQKRWRQVQFLANEFWTRWRKEYLQSLQSRAKWGKVKRNFEVGDVVLLKDEELVRGNLKLARIVETTLSRDNLVRKVKLLMAASDLNKMGKRVKEPVYIERPVHKLVLVQENEKF